MAYQFLVAYLMLKFNSFVNAYNRNYTFNILLYFIFMSLIIFFRTVVYQVFLFNINNLRTAIWFQIFLSNTNNLHTAVWLQDFLSNTKNSHTVV